MHSHVVNKNKSGDDLCLHEGPHEIHIISQLHPTMDPFSVVVGVGSLVEISLQLGKYLKNVYEAAASFEDDIGSLFRELKDLESVNKSIEHLHNTEAAIYNFGLPELPRQGVEVWQNIAKILENCSETLEDLRKVLEAVIGSSGVKVTGRRDGIKKHLRKQAKDGELETMRLKLSVHRESLSVSLTLLNLYVFALGVVRYWTF